MVSRAEFEIYCLEKSGVTKEYPFDAVTAVFKVKDKMFALTNDKWETFQVNLKCDPEWSMILRGHYEEVEPGYHMNKKHWNTVNFEGTIPDDELLEMIDHSYRLVVSKLPKKVQEQLRFKH